MSKRSKNKGGSRDNSIRSRVDVLNKIRDSMRKELTTEKRDRNSENYLKEVKKSAESKLQKTISSLHNIKFGNTIIENYKLESVYHKRRIAAVVSYAPQTAERFEDKFPSLDIEGVLAQICAEPIICTADTVNEYDDILLACAIFILDELYNNHNIYEALLYIPWEEELISEIDLPEDFVDACYEDNVIQGMMFLILHRNDSEKYGFVQDVFMNPVSVKRTAADIQPIEYNKSNILFNTEEDVYEYRKKIRSEACKMSFRERFDKIISFIRPETIRRSSEKFEQKFWEYLEIVFKGIEYYDNIRVKAINRALEITDKLINIERSIEKVSTAIHDTQKPQNTVAAVSMARFMPDIEIDENISVFHTNRDYTARLDRDAERVAEYADKLEELEDEKNTASYHISVFIDYALNIKKVEEFDSENFDEVNETCRRELDEFRVNNPYEICFAYLYLIDRGSDLPWLAGLSGAVLSYAYDLLPWTKDENPALYDIIDERIGYGYGGDDDEDRYTDPIIPDNDNAADNSEAEEIFYSPVYSDYCNWAAEDIKRVRKDDLLRLNFPQFVYNQVTVNIPRRLNIFEKKSAAFKKSGFSSKHIDLLKMYLFLGLEISNRIGFPECEYEDIPDEKAEEENIDALKKTITEKNAEISRLKKQLHKAENEASEERKKTNRILSDSEADRQELLELRELIYKLQNNYGEETSEDDNDNIPLPYRAEQRIVIFGGHASWLRAIKPLLPNVRFIDPYTNPDPNLIRNADVVWMQTNAMPHSFYNKIMDIVRQNKIPVKYFAYASAEKCAGQLAADDMKNGNNENGK